MKTLFFIFLMFYASSALASLEIERTVKETDRLTVTSFAYIFDDDLNCDVCLFPGLSTGQLNFEAVGESVYWVGADVYARIAGGEYLSFRWGFGFAKFDRAIKNELENTWDFHVSMQSGWKISEAITIIMTLHHWSNGLAFARQFGVDGFWPDTNDGGNTLTLGIIWRE